MLADGSYFWNSSTRKTSIIGSIPRTAVKQVVSAAKYLKMAVVLNLIGDSFGAGDADDFDYMKSCGDPEARIFTYEYLPIVDSCIQILLIAGRSPESAIRGADKLSELVGAAVALRPSAPGYISFTRAGVSKGAALRQLIESLHLAKERTLSIGDGFNDIPMFLESGFSVAMDHSEIAVQRTASTVIKYDEGYGVARFLVEIAHANT